MPTFRKILRKRAVVEKTGLSKATIDRQEARGLFPSRILLGERSVGWYDDEVDAHLESRRKVQPKSATA
jgi:prophage regulatory protein